VKIILVLFLGLLTVTAFPQNKPDQSAELAKGSLLRVVLSEQMDVENAKVGDVISTSVRGLVTGHRIKRPSAPLTLIGHITAVEPRTGNAGNLKLSLAFDKIVISSQTGEPRSLPVTGVIKRVLTMVIGDQTETSRPPSGDNPSARADGPPVDIYGHPLSRPSGPLSVPGPRGNFGPFEEPVEGIVLHPDTAGNVTVMVCKRRNILLPSEAVMIVEVTGVRN
jgi:hypothetical protein